jgi:hypothetical protein
MHQMTVHKILLVVFFLIAVRTVAALEVSNIPQIGPHEPILIVEKNVHPENLMIVYTKVDEHGHFVPNPLNPIQPFLDFYWLINGKTYKPVSPLIKSEIRKRLEIEVSPTGAAKHFAISINDLKEVKTDMKQPRVDVYARDASGSPNAEAEMDLGPSDRNIRIKVSSIYTDGRAFPPAVYSVTVEGEEIANGKPTGRKITRTYDAK